MFQGSMVALVTPMQRDGSIDKKAFLNLIEWHIAAKTKAIVVVGTTGEASTLSEAEQYDLISSAVKQAAKRVPIIAGTGTHSTQHTVTLTKNAKKAGADAALIVTPYYNKPTQAGLFQHYQMIAEQALFPIILYNVPGRTACDLLPDTVERLSRLQQIVGIKEATGKLDRALDIIARCNKSFDVYSGDDATALGLMQHGAKGVISVTANVSPGKMHALCEAALSGNHGLANQIQAELMPLHQALFLESNPIPVKWALAELGLIPPGIRLPLSPLDAKYHDELKAAMRKVGVV